MFLRAVAAGLPCYRLSQVVAAAHRSPGRFGLRQMRGAVLRDDATNENGRAEARPSHYVRFAGA